MKVVVLMGGRSSEREISLRTGRGIAQSLRNLGHAVVALDTATGRALPPGDEESGAPPAGEVRKLPATVQASAVAEAASLHDAEIVFVALHGGEGEDGTIQALLDLAGRPYTGSGVMASAIAMNKAMSKKLFVHEGVPTPKWRLLEFGESPGTIDLTALGGLPLIVKPNADGSSVGLTVVNDERELPAAIDLAARYGEVLLEQFIPGRELTVAVVGDEALPIVEIRPHSGHYDYESKYTKGASDYFCPADLPEPLAAKIRELGVRASRCLGCEGVSRVDFRLSPDDVPYCLEVNTIPGMTPTSLVPMAAKASGLSYDQLVQRMLELAAADWKRRHGGTPAPGASAGVKT